MRVVHVSVSDIGWGGASIAAYRLHRALRKAGIDSWMLVQDKRTDDYTVLSVDGGNRLKSELNRYRSWLDKVPLRIFYRRRQPMSFTPGVWGFSEVVKRLMALEPAVVHLHWIGGGTLPIKDLPKIPFPVVWTMHDQWPFTGGCHFSGICERYAQKCGKCPILNSRTSYDLSRWIWERKKRTYPKVKKIAFIAVSSWMEEAARKSSLLRDLPIYRTPYLIDTHLFSPNNKNWCRSLWGLGQDVKYIGFGALSATSDPRKGFSYIVKALPKLAGEKVEAIIWGSSSPAHPPDLGIPVHYVGYVHDEVSLVTLYNALDVVVVPSRYENFPLVTLEALACGVPVVAFAVGGLLDLIDHKVNGYLARPYEVEDLAAGIQWALQMAPNLQQAARQKVLQYSEKTIVAQCLQIYRSLTG